MTEQSGDEIHFSGFFAQCNLWIMGLHFGAWAWIFAAAWFTGRPILYQISGPMAPETQVVVGLFLLQGVIFMRHVIVGSGFSSNMAISPIVTIVSGVLLLLWHFNGPAPGAHYFPLVGLILFSAFMWFFAFFLGGQTEDRQRVARPAGEGADQSEEPAAITRPQVTFSSIFGNEAVKQRLKDAAQTIISSRQNGEKPRNGILLHGDPGNGKTIFAEALAGELGLPLVSLSYADVASQWVGEKSARVRAAFEQAKSNQPCVLFLDEVDSFVEARDGRGDGVKEDRDLTNALLTLMVGIREHRVILVAATNHMYKLDGAAVREGRFDFKVEISQPDAQARLGLLWKGLNDNLPGFEVDQEMVEAVAKRWNGFSVKRILAVTEELPSYMKEQGGRKKITYKDLMGALRQLQGQRGEKPENFKKLSEMLLAKDTRISLDLIAGRMADPDHTERYGGTLPTGVLFSGPPGTGKTATAKALAAEIGWAFLPTTGAELARNPVKLEELYTKAKDLRPTLIFIDEADELLRTREFSDSTNATNKLLTLMDGVGDRVRDVVWVAATNHPESIDPALLRGGRFTEKVRFHLPEEAAITQFVEGWLQQRKVQLAEGLEPRQVALVIGQATIANVEAILQTALNCTIARRTVPVVVTAGDFEQAIELVL